MRFMLQNVAVYIILTIINFLRLYLGQTSPVTSAPYLKLVLASRQSSIPDRCAHCRGTGWRRLRQGSKQTLKYCQLQENEGKTEENEGWSKLHALCSLHLYLMGIN